ncbi:hypothetical protein [Meiothermus cerbereus]|uniref:hypothetical protein n=1 Tax=Meiothermus cerbereus TaxID=65552 RepID=UPI003EEB0C09
MRLEGDLDNTDRELAVGIHPPRNSGSALRGQGYPGSFLPGYPGNQFPPSNADGDAIGQHQPEHPGNPLPGSPETIFREEALLAGALPTSAGNLLRAERALHALEGGEVALRVEGSLTLSPGQGGSIPVQVLSPFPVRVEVRPEGGLSAYLSPNPAQGQAFLRVRAGTGLAPGTYRVALVAGGSFGVWGPQSGARAQAEVRVVQGPEARVVLEACSSRGCERLVLPKEGGPFRLEANPGEAYRLLAFLDADGNGTLDQEEPRDQVEVVAPVQGVGLVVR